MFFFIFITITFSHNWIHGTSRAPKASQLLPAPPRAGPRQPHRQVGANQDFVMEWVTGHPGSFYYFVVLKSTDEDKLELHTESMLNEYISNAPADAYLYTAEKYQRMHISCTYNHPNSRKADCAQTTWNSGEGYERQLTPQDSIYIDRSGFDPNPASDMAHFKYNPRDLAYDKRVAYFNPDFPWIEAVHKFRITHRFPKEWDAARISLPGRQGSGEYMIHMMWRGYRDVIDVDILPAPANDMYGRAGGNQEWIKSDHCQYTKYNARRTTCRYVQPGDSLQQCLDDCVARGTRRCTAVNVVPLFTPSEVKIQGHAPADANIPWFSQVGNRGCRMDRLPSSADEDTLVCYGFIPSQPDDPTFNPETENKWYVRENDPEDPIFYSTCYRLEVKREFIGNPPCPLCEGEPSTTPPRWQIGDQCLDCQSISDSSSLEHAKFWKLADICDKCF